MGSRALRLLTYPPRLSGPSPPPPPSCPRVSRQGVREGRRGAGPVAGGAPPRSRRCRASTAAPGRAVDSPVPGPPDAGSAARRDRRPLQAVGGEEWGTVCCVPAGRLRGSGAQSPRPEARDVRDSGEPRGSVPGVRGCAEINFLSHPSAVTSAGLSQPNPSLNSCYLKGCGRQCVSAVWSRMRTTPSKRLEMHILRQDAWHTPKITALGG